MHITHATSLQCHQNPCNLAASSVRNLLQRALQPANLATTFALQVSAGGGGSPQPPQEAARTVAALPDPHLGAGLSIMAMIGKGAQLQL
jgi:hypothetical protein